MQKSFCLQCKKEVKSNIKKCKCGGKSFAFGEKLKVVDGNIQCECGSNKIKRGMHTDYTDKFVDSGSCITCGAGVGIETYRSQESLMYWGYYDDLEPTRDKYCKRVMNRQRLFEKRKSLGRSM